MTYQIFLEGKLACECSAPDMPTAEAAAESKFPGQNPVVKPLVPAGQIHDCRFYEGECSEVLDEDEL